MPVTAYPAWTPASRPGIIPLHPLTFGTILGRSFSALRQNPRVLLGFALCVQFIAYLVLILAVGAVGWASFSRLDTLRPGTDDFEAVLAGSIALTVVVALVLSLATGALSVIVQGFVVSEVAHAAVAEKLTLGRLWQRVKPVAWRLVGYTFIVAFLVGAVVLVAGLAIFALAFAVPVVGILLTILVILATIPLALWLSTKLFVVPAAIVLEGASITGAIARSWRLTRGRFWSTLGIIVLISLVFGAIAQVVSLPFSFLTAGLGTVISPTGDSTATAVLTLIGSLILVEAVTLLIQAVSIVVQSTAAALVYIDCRMRHEGLDLDLLAYVERRDAGAPALEDPYRVHIGRTIAPRSLPAPGAYAPPAYAGQQYAPGPYAYAPGPYAPPQAYPGYAPPPSAYAPQNPYPGSPPQAPTYPPYGGQPPVAGPPPTPGPAATPPDAGETSAPTSWTAPGSPSADGTRRESPWG